MNCERWENNRNCIGYTLKDLTRQMRKKYTIIFRILRIERNHSQIQTKTQKHENFKITFKFDAKNSYHKFAKLVYEKINIILLLLFSEIRQHSKIQSDFHFTDEATNSSEERNCFFFYFRSLFQWQIYKFKSLLLALLILLTSIPSVHTT